MEEKLDKMLNLYEKGEEEEEAPQLIVRQLFKFYWFKEG